MKFCVESVLSRVTPTFFTESERGTEKSPSWMDLTETEESFLVCSNGHGFSFVTVLGNLEECVLLSGFLAHCRIPGNERADELAKQGAQAE